MILGYWIKLPRTWWTVLKIHYSYFPRPLMLILVIKRLNIFFCLQESPNSIPPTWTFTLQFVIVRYPSILFGMRLHKLLCVIGVWSIYNLIFSRRIDTLCLLQNWLSWIRFLRNHISIIFLVGFQVGISLVD